MLHAPGDQSLGRRDVYLGSGENIMPFRPTIIVAAAFFALAFAATDAIARSSHSHGARSSSVGHFIGARRGFGSYPYAYVPRRDAYTDYNDPICASVRRRVQMDYGLRWHRTRRCGY
jgi:hypothetical protein